MDTSSKKFQGNDTNAMLAAGWIPVTERTPPDLTPVLVFGWCCDICHNIRIAEYEVDGWWESYHGNDLTFDPEYWMPLPFPTVWKCAESLPKI